MRFTRLPLTSNTLISVITKGYAEYLLETQDHGVDRNVPGSGDGFVAAFANANALMFSEYLVDLVRVHCDPVQECEDSG